MRAGHFEKKEPDITDQVMPYPYIIPPTDYRDDKGEAKTAIALSWDDLQALKTPFFYRSMDVYNKFVVFGGTPHNNGWANENSSVISIIMVLKAAEGAYDKWEREKNAPQRSK